MIIDKREGEAITGTYATEGGAYVWRIAGSLRKDAIEWQFIEVVRETVPENVVGNAMVSGKVQGREMDLVFRHALNQSQARVTLRRQ